MLEVPTSRPDRDPSQQPMNHRSISEELSPPPPTVAERLDPDGVGAARGSRVEAARQHPALKPETPAPTPDTGPQYNEPTEQDRLRAQYGGFVPGETVKVRRSPNSGGHIEDGWRLLGRDKDNIDPSLRSNLLVGRPDANGEYSQTKSITASDLHGIQEQPVSQPHYETQALPPRYYENPAAVEAAGPAKPKRNIRNLFGLKRPK